MSDLAIQTQTLTKNYGSARPYSALHPAGLAALRAARRARQRDRRLENARLDEDELVVVDSQEAEIDFGRPAGRPIVLLFGKISYRFC